MEKIVVPEITEEMLDGVARRIVEHCNPYKIVLFGSRAWGRPGRHSDLDILVIMDSEERPAQRAARLSLLARPKFVPMDILVRTPREIEQRLAMGDFFIRRILEKGRVLYER